METAPLPAHARCCIVGGGPAGMMLGYLLARAGIDVVVLEKHADFLRDFRGDTVHPSTLDVLDELGLLDAFLQRPHDELERISGVIGGKQVDIADFSHTPTRKHFIVFMPQWDFLDFLAEQGRRLPNFHLHMQAEATGLIRNGDRIAGLRVRTPHGETEVRADLVVAADGRHSALRSESGLPMKDLGAPIDVLWMQLPKRGDVGGRALGYFDRGRVLVLLDRNEYWQAAYVIRKGGIDAVKARGLDALRRSLVEGAPHLRESVEHLKDWDSVRLLTVSVDRLQEWALPGLLCIGDCAHAMSPIGGVGINLAIQDAVATANLLAGPLRDGSPSLAQLQAVQRRRMFPTRVTQAFQLMVQNNVLGPAIAGERPVRPPLILRIVNRCKWLQRLPARFIGVGVRPEHVRSPDAAASGISPANI